MTATSPNLTSPIDAFGAELDALRERTMADLWPSLRRLIGAYSKPAAFTLELAAVGCSSSASLGAAGVVCGSRGALVFEISTTWRSAHVMHGQYDWTAKTRPSLE